MYVWTFFRKGGGRGLPNAKLFEELFCLCLDIFQEMRGGGLPDTKDDEEHFLFLLGHFSSQIWGDNQSPNTLRNFSWYKIRF